MVYHALTFMYWKIMLGRCYCINSTIYLLKFGKLYGTIFCHRLTVTIFVTIFEYPSTWPQRIKRFQMAAIIRFDLDISKMTVQNGCCATVVVQNELQIHQQKLEKPTYICNNFPD